MKRTLIALGLVLVLALGTLGVGYALWFEELYIDGTVYTGDVDVEWSLEGMGSDETKEVSIIDAYIEENTLYVTIDNAYPCVTYWVLFDIHSIGSIPVHFTDFELDLADMPAGATVTIAPASGGGKYPEGTTPITQAQLHECEEWWGLLELHLDNTAEENSTYTFSATVMAHQYNETPGD